MLSFKQFLLNEDEQKNIPPIIPYAPLSKAKPTVPKFYSDPATGVKSYFHTTPKGESYWGYGITDSSGNVVDTPPEGLSPQQKSSISRAARGHMEDFIKTNPEVKKITYQTNPTPQGEANRAYFKDKMWPEMQQKTGTKISFERVSKNPLVRSPLTIAAASVGAGIVGGLAGEYLVKPAAEKTGVFDAVEKGTRIALTSLPQPIQNAAATAVDATAEVGQWAIDPLGSYNQFLANQARKSKHLTSKQKEEAQVRYEKQNF